jgi:hypothetical protein
MNVFEHFPVHSFALRRYAGRGPAPLRDEIVSRDIFWLFWSREAMKSPWVEWEWRTALAAKTIDGIQPHPLEPSDLAPAPEELSALQFGTIYEWYTHHLRGQDL